MPNKRKINQFENSEDASANYSSHLRDFLFKDKVKIIGNEIDNGGKNLVRVETKGLSVGGQPKIDFKNEVRYPQKTLLPRFQENHTL